VTAAAELKHTVTLTAYLLLWLTSQSLTQVTVEQRLSKKEQKHLTAQAAAVAAKEFRD
jgi:hypothetical protein